MFQWWDHVDVVQCNNFLHYLTYEFADKLVTFTLVDQYMSSAELRFISDTKSGLGGFYQARGEADDDDEWKGISYGL